MSSVRRLKLGLRAVLLGVCVVFGGMLLLNPASQVKRLHPNREEVVFWHMWTGEWKLVIDRIVDEFNRSQDRYEVTALSLPGNEANTKLLLSVAGGDPPDVMAQWNCVIPTWSAKNVIRPLDSLMTPDELADFRRTMYPVVWKVGAYQGHFYGLCAGLNVRALFYLPSHFREAGLDPARPPKTISELDEMARKLYKVDKNGAIQRVGFLPDYMHFWGPSFGASFCDESTGKLTIDTPANTRVLAWMRGYRERYGLQNILRYESSLQSGVQGSTDWPFITGAYSIVLDGQWRVEQLARYAPNLEYMTSPPPAADNGGLENACHCNGNFMVIPRGSKCPKGAWEFMKFWSGISDPATAAKFYVWGGWMPISQKIVDAPDFQKYLEKHPQMRTFVNMLPSENLQPAPPVILQNFFMERMTQMAQRVTRLSETPQQGLQGLVKEMAAEEQRLKETAR